ncbi:MAG: hypothetical protein Q8M29_05570 [Bacteroidota bacterium]|nr:hypothetical protein [Bacteroidota bacterium]
MDQFEDIIKQKLSSEEFPFDENNWEKASALIDADRKSKKRRAFICWFLGGLLLLGGMSFLVFFPAKKNQYSQNKTSTGYQKNNSSAIVKENKTVQSDAEPDHINNTNNTKTTSALKNISVKHKATPIPTSSIATYSDKTIKKHKPGSTGIKNKAPVSILSSATDVPDNASTSIILKPNEQKSNETANKGIDTSIAKISYVDASLLKDSIPVVLTDSLKKDSLPGDIASDSILEILPKKNSLEIVMGAAWSTPWTNDVKNIGRGLSPIAGISYERKIRSHYGVSIGLQLNTFYNRSNPAFVSRTINYGFGKTTYVHTTRVNYMQYISIPVRFAYPANKKGNFSFGVNIGYLIDSRIERELYAGRDLGGSSVITTFDNGVYKGFHSVDAQLAIAYRRKMPNRFSLQLECFYGLTDVFDNEILGVNSFERNKGIKFTLGYELFRK